jgi:hypothetical protein
MAVLRACATSSLMRLDSDDGADETGEASRAGGIELAIVLICNFGSLKPSTPVPCSKRELRSGTGNAVQFNDPENSPKKRPARFPSPACLTRPLVGFPYQNDPI